MKNWPRHELLPYAIIGVVLLLGGFALTVALIFFTGRANWSSSGTVPLLLTLLLAASVVGLTGIPFVATVLGEQCTKRGWLMIFGSTAAVFIGSIVTGWTVFATPIAMVFFCFACAVSAIWLTWRDAPIHICDGCGYDLRGTPGPVCPECGARI